MQVSKRFGLLIPAAMAVCLFAASHTPTGAAQTAAAYAASNPAKTPAPASRVDINRASVDELLKVPGMTATWAARIVRFRPYRSKQDLVDRGVLPPDVYSRIKDYIIAHRDDN